MNSQSCYLELIEIDKLEDVKHQNIFDTYDFSFLDDMQSSNCVASAEIQDYELDLNEVELLATFDKSSTKDDIRKRQRGYEQKYRIKKKVSKLLILSFIDTLLLVIERIVQYQKRMASTRNETL